MGREYARNHLSPEDHGVFEQERIVAGGTFDDAAADRTTLGNEGVDYSEPAAKDTDVMGRWAIVTEQGTADIIAIALRSLLSRIVSHHFDEWAAESMAAGGISCLPRLEQVQRLPP